MCHTAYLSHPQKIKISLSTCPIFISNMFYDSKESSAPLPIPLTISLYIILLFILHKHYFFIFLFFLLSNNSNMVKNKYNSLKKAI